LIAFKRLFQTLSTWVSSGQPAPPNLGVGDGGGAMILLKQPALHILGPQVAIESRT
jgi:hypothetical protein